MTVEIDYEGVLKMDIPNGSKAGETLRLKGKFPIPRRVDLYTD